MASTTNQKSGIGTPDDLVRATVEQDRFVLVEWQEIDLEDLDAVFLEKSFDNGNTWGTIATLAPSATSFLDTAVNVQEAFYTYRLNVRDSCGFTSDYTNVGTSILLNIDSAGLGGYRLFWTPYQAWARGVDFYSIELFNEQSNSWVERGVVAGDVLEFTDLDVFLDQGEFCYRVLAYERGGNLAVSVSNQVCVPVQPKLYAPSAFSPNLDNVNDEFLLKGIFVREFNLQIFNRWGLKLFESNNINEGWDGRHDGAGVPEGVYVFTATGMYNTGQPFVLKGTITLIR
ncbi:MAG: gliding motility-associated C-terminal domain-containing protein [Bacteroidota bacterium]